MTKRLLPLLLTALLSASAFAAAPPAEAVPALASTSEDVRALAEAAELIRTQAGKHRLILLGEMHGTREAPKLLAALATVYAQQGPVAVGLELGESLQPSIDAFMASDGGERARAKLLADPYWQVPRARNDGRRNLEVVSLFGYLRTLKAQGRKVSVFAFDPRPVGKADAQAGDRAMAQRIQAALSKFPAGRMLTLSGNVHAMSRRPALAPHIQEPMGSFLRDQEPFTVDIAARGGEFWACSDGACGPKKQPAVFTQSGPADVFDLRVVLPRFTLARIISE